MATKKRSSTSRTKAAKKAVKKRARKSAASSSSKAANEIDRQLARYQSMRDFTVTAEPSGKSRSAAKPGKLPFVIQKHAASHLHYDFRLGWNGVLKSWACAKGPSYFPGDRRLAVQVEDHPIEYGGFEGIIPAGQYGGGTVMLWDQGTWEPQPGHTDVDAGLRDGSLKFTLHGTRMQGNWTLVRMEGKAASESKPNWLLIKEHDGFERTKDDPAITDEAVDSAATGRSMDQIASAGDHVWNSKDTVRGDAWHRVEPSATPSATKPTAKAAAKALARSPRRAAKTRSTALAKAPKESLPAFIEPQLATQATVPAANPGWVHEIKLDGYRVQARLDHGKVRLLTRSGLDWTHRMASIAAGVAALPAKFALLDGEVVVLRADGNSSFADLQAAFQNGEAKPLTFFVFDLLHLNGHSLRSLPLLERKSLLADLLQDSPETLRLSEHLDADATAVFARACELHTEGIVSKRADAPYVSGRSSSWIKLKCIHEQEFVVAGFTLPAKGHAGIHGIGSLLLGYYDSAQRLIYAGRTGTGFDRKTHSLLRTRLESLRQTAIPFHNPPAEAGKGAIWVKPTLVAQVRFATWTAENLLRQAAFQGLREDKPARQVVREDAVHEESASEPHVARKIPRKAARHSSRPPLAAKTAAKTAAITKTAPVRLTHPDKILDPESGLTKQQLADFYWAIAPHMLPQIEGRPLSIVRCPEGSAQPCFFQKHTTTMLPPGIGSIDVPDKKTGKPEPYITLSTPEALASLAQMGVLEVHPWGSRNDDLEHPDRIVIDLDPDAAISWPTLAAAADDVRQRLHALGLESFLKSTGGKGLHIVVPIEPEHDWPTVKRFAHSFALALEASQPSLYLTKMTKSARAGRIYIDYLRNERGATSVAAFSPRARPGAPVSLPLAWKDLELDGRPLFHVSDYAAWKPRLARDPWKKLPATRQRLTEAALNLSVPSRTPIGLESKIASAGKILP
jgi:bifunctional non-homologous end joining protein LigD